MSRRAKSREKPHRPPYWLPATSFYFLVFGIAVAAFFLVILIFHDSGEEFEVVTAGLVFSGVLITGVIVREVILRHARERHFAHRKLLDRSLGSLPARSGEFSIKRKFTLQENAIALDTIKRRSEAAMVFGRIAAGHREVFELCEEYRRIIVAEIPNTHPDSPRLKAMLKGKQHAAKLHEYHMLKWAEIESNEFAQKAAEAENYKDRRMCTEKARGTIELALRNYPENSQLRASELFLENLGENDGVAQDDGIIESE